MYTHAHTPFPARERRAAISQSTFLVSSRGVFLLLGLMRLMNEIEVSLPLPQRARGVDCQVQLIISAVKKGKKLSFPGCFIFILLLFREKAREKGEFSLFFFSPSLSHEIRERKGHSIGPQRTTTAIVKKRPA